MRMIINISIPLPIQEKRPMVFSLPFERYQSFNFRHSFTPEKEVRLGDKSVAWTMGIFSDQAEGRNLRCPAAKTRGGIPILFWPTSRDAQGNVASYELRTIATRKMQPIDGSQLPDELIMELRDMAHSHQAFAVSGDFSLAPKHATGQVVDSHRFATEGAQGIVQVIHYKSGDLAGLLLEDRQEGRSGYYQLNVQDVDDNGRISHAVLQKEVKKNWQVVPDESIPQEMLQELYRFAHAHKLYAEVEKKVQERAEQAGNDILLEKDMDGEIATMLRDHYAQKLDEALDRGDKEAFKEIAPMAKAYKEAAEALNKPRNHAQRIAFERKQAELLEKAGQGRG